MPLGITIFDTLAVGGFYFCSLGAINHVAAAGERSPNRRAWFKCTVNGYDMTKTSPRDASNESCYRVWHSQVGMNNVILPALDQPP